VITAEIWGVTDPGPFTKPHPRGVPEPIAGVAHLVPRPVPACQIDVPLSRTNPDLLSRVVVNNNARVADVEVYMYCVERSEVERVARSRGLERGAGRVVGHQ
jgi:hypothetical protein